MKRKTLKFVACAAMMALTLSVTACGGSDSGSSSSTSDSTKVEDTAGTEDTTEPEAEPETKAEDEAGTDATEESDSGEGYATLEEALADPEMKEEFEAQFLEASQDDGMSLSYEVSGNEFTYLLKIEDPSLMGDDMAEQLQEALDSEEAASIYQPIAQVLDYVIEQEGACTVTIHYLDPDGNIMAEKSFKAN